MPWAAFHFEVPGSEKAEKLAQRKRKMLARRLQILIRPKIKMAVKIGVKLSTSELKLVCGFQFVNLVLYT